MGNMDSHLKQEDWLLQRECMHVVAFVKYVECKGLYIYISEEAEDAGGFKYQAEMVNFVRKHGKQAINVSGCL